MVKHRDIILCGLVFITIFTGACQKDPAFECRDAIGCVTIKPDEPVKIGIIQDFSGAASVFGTVQLRSIQLAIAHRDKQLLGHPLELQVEDELCTMEGGKNAALKIVTYPQTVAILGTTCSMAAVAASEIMSEAGLAMISGINSAASLTTSDGQRKGADWQAGYFRVALNDGYVGLAAANFAFQELGMMKAAAIDDGDTYTRGATLGFIQEFTRLGGEVVLAATVDKGDVDMKAVLERVFNAGAELLYFPLFPPEGLHLARQANHMTELNHVILLGGTALTVETFVKGVGDDGIGIYFASPTLPEGVDRDTLFAAYKSAYGEEPLNGYSSAYDAVNMLFNAIETVAARQEDGTLHIGRQALRDALYATVDFEGATGRLSCNRFGDCGLSKFTILRLDNPAAGVQGLKTNVVYTYQPE